MSIPGAGNPLLLGGAGGYKIERSLRFNGVDAYLSRTPASAGNRKTWTWSGWVKLPPSGALPLFGGGTVSAYEYFYISNGTLGLLNSNFTIDMISFFRLRDPSAWYHIVLSVNTTQAISADRVKVYINGIQGGIATSLAPSLNYEFNINNSVLQLIGKNPAAASYFSGYLAEVHFIDGQALTPSSFGETDINGIWQPKAYAGTYGTNGFKLNFADNSAGTAATLGKDTSGNGNNWTPTASLGTVTGTGSNSLVDSPTNYGTDTGAGGEVRGNYCTWNPLDLVSTSVANGNLQASGSTDLAGISGTIGVSSGKWYWEVTAGSVQDCIGIWSTSSRVIGYPGYTSDSYGYYGFNGQKINSNVATAYGSTFTVNDIIGVALNLDAGTLTFYKNNVSQGTAFTGLSGGFRPAVRAGAASSPSTATYLNAGQRPFAYTAPSGYKALCTQNLPAPTITKPSTVMDVALWTGNGSARSITGLGFNPDLVWIKGRSGATDHALYDSVRGAEKRLESNTTDAEVTSDGGVTAFNSDGFSLGTLAQVNTNTATYAGWTWDAGSSTVTNTAGTISSQVRANASAGFSIVGYTCQSSGTGTIGHGLGVAPEFIITKQRAGTGFSWTCYHKAIGLQYILLNSTAAAGTLSTVWPTAATSTVFTQGTGFAGGGDMIAYCFAPVAGYSAFGSYTGNGSADGPFVFLGFRPAVVLVKMSSSTGNWTMLDYQREGYNVDNDPLYPNLANAEGTTDLIDITSNGFKVRTTDASFNTNAGTYIYAAWAQSPFALARAR